MVGIWSRANLRILVGLVGGLDNGQNLQRGSFGQLSADVALPTSLEPVVKVVHHRSCNSAVKVAIWACAGQVDSGPPGPYRAIVGNSSVVQRDVGRGTRRTECHNFDEEWLACVVYGARVDLWNEIVSINW